jgi:Uma2 family endonuclease
MNVMAKERMTVDEFLAWAAGRPGKYELHGGIVQQMSPERAKHVRVKYSVCAAFKAALKESGLECEALIDGMTVRVSLDRAFVPDVLVHCQSKLDGESVEVDEPVIIVEVQSPSTGFTDESTKLTGYFAVPSVRHYLLVDPDQRTVVHHRRAEGDVIETRIVRSGAMTLDPPGIEIGIGAFFEDL